MKTDVIVKGAVVLKIVKCKEGHYYNSDNYSRCPICEEREQENVYNVVYASPEVMSGKYRREENRVMDKPILPDGFSTTENSKSTIMKEPILPAGIPANYHEYKTTEAYLTINTGDMKGRSFKYLTTPIEIGREIENGVQLSKSYKSVSRHHCTIWYNENSKTFTIKDFSSTGILYKNGQRLKEIEEVQPGTALYLGSSECEIILSIVTPSYPYNGTNGMRTDTIYNAPGL